MNSSSWGLLALYLGLLLLAAWPLGIWLARLSSGKLPD
jgi:potassium-transporting ATPase potassium-binding subunit